jgi:hypothetical protein
MSSSARCNFQPLQHRAGVRRRVGRFYRRLVGTLAIAAAAFLVSITYGFLRSEDQNEPIFHVIGKNFRRFAAENLTRQLKDVPFTQGPFRVRTLLDELT